MTEMHLLHEIVLIKIVYSYRAMMADTSENMSMRQFLNYHLVNIGIHARILMEF